jgi:hypothetical protein
MTIGLEDDGDPTTGLTGGAMYNTVVDMDLEERTMVALRQETGKAGRSTLQTEAAKTAGNTHYNGMQKIDEVDKEEEDKDKEILGMKTRSLKKINISFKVKLDGEKISSTDTQSEHEPMKGSNKPPMSHHPIMSKIANFVAAAEKRCKIVKVISSKNKLVLDTKSCMDSWLINKFKAFFAYSVVKNWSRNVQVTLGRFPPELTFLNTPRRCAIPRDSPKFFKILRIEMKNYSHHHDNGNVLNQSSMDIAPFITNLSDEI